MIWWCPVTSSSDLPPLSEYNHPSGAVCRTGWRSISLPAIPEGSPAKPWEWGTSSPADKWHRELMYAIRIAGRKHLSTKERDRACEFLGCVDGHGGNYLNLAYSLTHERPPPASLWAEFGVFMGNSVNISSQIRQKLDGGTVHGFDTFTGLPETWGHVKQGTFSLGGALPPVNPNVVLHKGLFSETLPPFLASWTGEKRVGYVNVDMDLYAGAMDVLNHLGPWMANGTLLHFHELVHASEDGRGGGKHKGLPMDEAKALLDWLTQNGAARSHVGAGSSGKSHVPARRLRALQLELIPRHRGVRDESVVFRVLLGNTHRKISG